MWLFGNHRYFDVGQSILLGHNSFFTVRTVFFMRTFHKKNSGASLTIKQ